jgi:hypothetical protein
MKCDWIQKVSLLIDDELPHAEAREVERHLGLCGDCQTAREDFLLLRRQLAAYPLELDAAARQRALRRVLAAGGSGGAKFEMETAAATPRRREAFAGLFGLPQLKPAGLAALLLLLFGVVVGIVALKSARRAPVEITSNAPVPAHSGNSTDASPAVPPAATPDAPRAATPNLPPNAPDDLTANAGKREAGEKVGPHDRVRTGEATAKAAREDAQGGVPANAPRIVIARAGSINGANVRRVESAYVRRVESANVRRVESALGRRAGQSPVLPNFDRPRVDAPVVESAEGNDVVTGDADDARDAEAVAAARREREGAEDVARAGAPGASKTARHVEQAQLLLRSFRNARPIDAGRRASSDLAYDKERSKKLLYENIVLRREAASRGNLPVESLLDSLEPILIDIANLPDRPAPAVLREINERMRRKNLVAMLQISAVESASARSY